MSKIMSMVQHLQNLLMIRFAKCEMSCNIVTKVAVVRESHKLFLSLTGEFA
jgi:hypothetical protein